MQSKYAILHESEQESEQTAQEIAHILEEFLVPLLIVLDRLLDKRLVRTLVQCCVAIIRFRNIKQGLLLSELRSYIWMDIVVCPKQRQQARKGSAICCDRSNGVCCRLTSICSLKPIQR